MPSRHVRHIFALISTVMIALLFRCRTYPSYQNPTGIGFRFLLLVYHQSLLLSKDGQNLEFHYFCVCIFVVHISLQNDNFSKTIFWFSLEITVDIHIKIRLARASLIMK